MVGFYMCAGVATMLSLTRVFVDLCKSDYQPCHQITYQSSLDRNRVEEKGIAINKYNETFRGH